MSRWFRYHNEALDDPKVQRLSADLFKAWVNLLCLASRGGGKILCEAVAFGLRLSPAQAAKVMVDLGQAGLMVAHDGYYVPHNWDARQFKSDVTDPTNAARQKRYRKNHSNGHVTENTVTKTVTDKRPDTEQNRTDKEIDSASARSSKIRPEAFSLSNDCLLAIGLDPENLPPDWCGLPWKIEMMLAADYMPQTILGTAVRHGAQRPLKPMNYFVKCVESSQQNQIKPAGAPNAKSGNVVQAMDKLLKQVAYFDQPAPIEARICSGEGENSIRAISSR